MGLFRDSLSIEQGKSSFLKVKLKNQLESEDKADIIVFNRNQIISTSFLKFNPDNWDEDQRIELNFREDRENKNNRQKIMMTYHLFPLFLCWPESLCWD